jgi:transcriptional regulator with XRE-family HTH domain
VNGRALVEFTAGKGKARPFAGVAAFDAGVDRSYLGGLERQEENPTVDVLDRLASTLSIPISEFFVLPGKGSLPPRPLKSGRRPAR